MADLSEKLEFLKKNIDEQLTNVQRRRVDYKNKAYKFFFISTLLSGVTTVILAFNFECFKEAARIIALILTTCVTILNALNSFFSHKELWVANNIALTRLLQLKFNINYEEQAATSVSDESTDKYKQIFQEILDDLNNSWQKNKVNQKS